MLILRQVRSLHLRHYVSCEGSKPGIMKYQCWFALVGIMAYSLPGI
jgi:hypothetical protein